MAKILGFPQVKTVKDLSAAPESHPILDKYEVIYANRGNLIKECQRIRYQVYCEELGFEKTREGMDCEADHFDSSSHHYLIRDRYSKEYLGTIRLIDSAHTTPNGLPIQQLYQRHNLPMKVDPADWATGSFTEVSRLAVLKTFRQAIKPKGLIDKTKRQQNSPAFISNLLYLSALAHFNLSHRMQLMLCLMEPRMVIRLRMVGILFEPVADGIEHRGFRVPFLLRKGFSEDHLQGETRELYTAVKSYIKACYFAQPTLAPVPHSHL